MKKPQLFASGHLASAVLLLNAGIAAPVVAQPLPSEILYDIRHTNTMPAIDGVYSGGEWADASHYELNNETEPGQNIPAPFHTDVYLMEDGENLLVAFVAQDPEPSRLWAFYRDRDKVWPDDRVGIVLDTFNDGRRAYEFWSNALGSQLDLINDDVAKNGDASWNAIWDSAGEITESGYVVEFRIPLRQLRFTSGLPMQTWGINFVRIHQRDVWQRMTDARYDFDRSCYLCQIPKGRGFPNVQQRTNVQLIPSLTAGASERRANPLVDSWQRDDTNTDAGIDLRWGINEGTILNATLNPDFSQVEADQAQLDVNNTFSLFFPERREFFLDGADYFNTARTSVGNFNGNPRLLYTRNISDPDFGLKLTGKQGNHNYGVLAANDNRTGFIIPGTQGSRVATLADTDSQNMALRYRYEAGRNLTMGLIGTSRDAEDYNNTMAGTDFNWQVANSDRIAGQFLHSTSDYPLAVQTSYNQKASLSDDAWALAYSHQGNRWYWNASASDWGSDFRADLGFVTRVGTQERLVNPGYQWRRGPDFFFNTVGVWSQWNELKDQSGLSLAREKRAGVWFNAIMQSYSELILTQATRYYNGQYFDIDQFEMWMEFSPWNGVRLSLNATTGDAIDFANTQPADALTLSPGFTVQFGRHLQAQLNYTHQELEVRGNELYTTSLADLRLTYQFDNNSFIRLVLIDDDTQRNPSQYRFATERKSRDLGTQLLYSYRVNAQTRFFVGYSDSAIANDVITDLEGTYRTVFAKFTYAWQY